MRKWYAAAGMAVLWMAALACAAGCGRRQGGTADAAATAAPPTASPVYVDTAPGAENAGGAAEDAEREAARSAYRAALENLLNNRVLPSGAAYEAAPGDGMAENRFAVYDVDMDGKEELLLAYASAYTAGEGAQIYAYDGGAGALRTELEEYPQLTFYDNGMIRADWSHNQGLAGSFWPYSLYRYDPDADSYVLAGMVDAWDKAFTKTGADGAPFPDDIDVSGSGFVYYIMTGGAYEKTPPVDAADYQAWYDGYMHGASEITVPYLPLTAENIEAAG